MRPDPIVGALLAALAAGDVPEAGHVAERVRCRARPRVSYALFLPSRAAPGRKLPLLVLLDARGRALLPLSLFMPAAEERGWALASSWDSRSDAASDPTIEAWESIRRDVAERFDVDERRIYVAGFSGTARLATLAGLMSPRPPPGVIACGAGFADGFPPRRDMPFAWFGAAGETDFNHDEMLTTAASLEALGAPHRLVVFPGGHEWAPPAVAADALAWMDLQAVRGGLVPGDPALVAERVAAGSAEARRDEVAGSSLDALRHWNGLARDLAGLADTRAFEKEATRLRGSPEVRRQEIDELEALRESRRQIAAWARALRRALAASRPPPAEKLVARLGVPELRKKAAAPPGAGASAAERLLSALRVRTSFYLPQERLEAGDLRGAALSLEVADAVRPGDPEILYDLARVRALAGDDAAALEALRKAVAAGFCDRRRLSSEPDFARLHGDSGFEGLLEPAGR